MTKSSPKKLPPAPGESWSMSVPRTVLAGVLAAAGIVWIVVYLNVAKDGSGLKWMGDITRWNFLIGFGLILLGLVVSAHKSTPLGRGRGVVIGMLGCFGLGLLWICTYYVIGTEHAVPLMQDLSQYNLLVGIAFMATGFVFATQWE